MDFAIDLLWVRNKKVGGIESYIRNLLDGFSSSLFTFHIYLLTSKDNSNTFKKYILDKRFTIIVCNIKSASVKKRIIWQNLHLGILLKKNNINYCFEPYYCKPFLNTRKVKFITTIHDLQAIHFPKYFSRFKVLWMKFSWQEAIKSSIQVIAISNYVKKDIEDFSKKAVGKTKVIYNPIIINTKETILFEALQKKYNIEKFNYYFTVSSLLPHKNLITLLNVFKRISSENINLPKKLVISGVGGKMIKEIEDFTITNNLEDKILLTGFVNNSERNSLYRYCKAFLFPSVFEGFGMPPIEAMICGANVLTTKETCIPEVTQNKAIYIDNPFDSSEWIDKMLKFASTKLDYSGFDFSKYELSNVVSQYYYLFHEFFK